MGKTFALAMLLLMASTASGQESPACGEGPHEITIQTPTECQCNKGLQRLAADKPLYFVLTACPETNCAKNITQTWTDWPECGGKIQEVPK